MIEETQLSKSEIKQLFEAVKTNVITDNPYNVSDPRELKNFEQFMMHNKPYDFVIDGLNSIKCINSIIYVRTKFIHSNNVFYYNIN